MKTIILDFDDFCENPVKPKMKQRFATLLNLKDAIPNLKVNLFTILGLCSPEFIQRIFIYYPWIDLIPHGWKHGRNECEKMDSRTSNLLLDFYELHGLTRGWKSPYWRTSPALYQALVQRGWWIADHPQFDHLRPAGLPCYKIQDGPEQRVHGHMGPACGNGLEEKFDYYASLRGEFKFIKDVI